MPSVRTTISRMQDTFAFARAWPKECHKMYIYLIIYCYTLLALLRVKKGDATCIKLFSMPTPVPRECLP